MSYLIRHYAIKLIRKVEVSLHVFLTSAYNLVITINNIILKSVILWYCTNYWGFVSLTTPETQYMVVFYNEGRKERQNILRYCPVPHFNTCQI